MACCSMVGMWLVFALLAEMAMTASTLSTSGCDIHIDRSLLPGIAPRIIPAPDADGMVIVWQDSDQIQLQRFTRDCKSVGSAVPVNSTKDFWRAPGQSGLGDAAGLGRGATAVAWIVGGDVWVRVINKDDTKSSVAVRANGPNRFDRAEVRIVANPKGDGFVVSWSSWMEDGDGWGVYVRPFTADASPRSVEETRVNVAVLDFQWHSQLAWCGNSLWALWENATGDSCSSGVDCTTGPFLRRLAGSSSEIWGTTTGPEELKCHGPGPLAAAIMCSDDDSKPDDAMVLWLARDGSHIGYNRSHVTASAEQGARPLKFGRRLASRPAISRPSSFLSWVRSIPFLGKASPDVTPFHLDGNAHLDGTVHHDFGPVHLDGTSFLAKGGSSDEIGNGQIAMLADGGLLVVLSNDAEGSLYVELLQLLDDDQGLRYPRRKLGTGAQAVRAAWDTTQSDSPALVACWATGGVAETELTSKFVCARMKAQWLVDDAGLEMDGKLALIVMVLFIGVFCCVRHCNHGGARGAPFNRRRIISDERGRQRRSANSARVQELRQQLAEIPDAAQEQGLPERPAEAEGREASSSSAPASAAAALELDQQSSSSTFDAGSTRWTPTNSITNECSICQNEVAVRIVLRPCGHTACKKCVTRIVEMNQPSICPFCRSAIDGVQTVYL